MRRINLIVVHCSATMEGHPFNAKAIDQMHRARGFNKIGYHYVVLLDGTVEEGRKEEEVGAHVSGYNQNSIGVCYIGGIGKEGAAKDTRTPQQKASLANLIRQLRVKYPGARVVGHRDLSPDINHDGRITPNEYIKQCPCFNVQDEYSSVNSATAMGGKLQDVPTTRAEAEAAGGDIPRTSALG